MGRSRSRSRTPPRRHKRSRSRSPSRRDKDRSSRRHRSRSRDRRSSRDRDRRMDRDRRRDIPERSKRNRRTSDSSPEDRRDRHRDRDRRRDRSRSRSRSDDRKPKVEPEVIEINDEDLEGKTDDEVAMMKAMGFCGFNTTKGNKVEGNDIGAVHHVVQRKYRQYMNRKGGFNRPLDYVN